MVQPLALELYHTIIQHINNTGDLLSLALCCSTFLDEAQRCLFCYVGPESQHQHKLLISAINSSPLRLGPLVHTYYIGEGTAWDRNDLVAESLSISLALPSMCNLEHLKINLPLPSTVLQGCTFKLRTLVCKGYDRRKPNLVFLFRNFLPTQPLIKHLHFSRSCVFDLAEVPKDLCPMLDFLEASDNTIISYLLRDDRLITRLQWNLTGGGMPAISIRQLNHLKYLQCDVNQLSMDSSFYLQLTSLVFLELQFERFGSEDANRLSEMVWPDRHTSPKRY